MPVGQPADEYEKIAEGIWQCTNCGAHADIPERVTHHAGCEAGEAKRWATYYDEQEFDEEDE